MSSTQSVDDRALVDGALQVVAALDAIPAARRLGVSVTTLADWRSGARPKLRSATRRLLAAAMAAPGGRDDVPSGLDPAAVAVGEFRAIEKMAGELARYAGEAGRRLELSAVSRPADPVLAKSVHAARKNATEGARKKA